MAHQPLSSNLTVFKLRYTTDGQIPDPQTCLLANMPKFKVILLHQKKEGEAEEGQQEGEKEEEKVEEEENRERTIFQPSQITLCCKAPTVNGRNKLGSLLQRLTKTIKAAVHVASVFFF